MAKIIKVQRRGALGGEATCRHCKQRGGPTQVPYQLVWGKGIGSLSAVQPAWSGFDAKARSCPGPTLMLPQGSNGLERTCGARAEGSSPTTIPRRPTGGANGWRPQTVGNKT